MEGVVGDDKSDNGGGIWDVVGRTLSVEGVVGDNKLDNGRGTWDGGGCMLTNDCLVAIVVVSIVRLIDDGGVELMT